MGGPPADSGLNRAIMSKRSVDEIHCLHWILCIFGRSHFVSGKKGENRARPNCNIHEIFWVAVLLVMMGRFFGGFFGIGVTNFDTLHAVAGWVTWISSLFSLDVK